MLKLSSLREKEPPLFVFVTIKRYLAAAGKEDLLMGK
jgi:hypothetical protein